MVKGTPHCASLWVTGSSGVCSVYFWDSLILDAIMVRGSRKVLAVGAVAALCAWQVNFVPGPLRKAAPAAAASAAMMMAPAAFADEIGDAAKKLGDASYDFAKEVDWNNGIFLQAPGQFQPLKALSAIDKMIDARLGICMLLCLLLCLVSS